MYTRITLRNNTSTTALLVVVVAPFLREAVGSGSSGELFVTIRGPSSRAGNGWEWGFDFKRRWRWDLWDESYRSGYRSVKDVW